MREQDNLQLILFENKTKERLYIVLISWIQLSARHLDAVKTDVSFILNKLLIKTEMN